MRHNSKVVLSVILFLAFGVVSFWAVASVAASALSDETVADDAPSESEESQPQYRRDSDFEAEAPPSAAGAQPGQQMSPDQLAVAEALNAAKIGVVDQSGASRGWVRSADLSGHATEHFVVEVFDDEGHHVGYYGNLAGFMETSTVERDDFNQERVFEDKTGLTMEQIESAEWLEEQGFPTP